MADLDRSHCLWYCGMLGRDLFQHPKSREPVSKDRWFDTLMPDGTIPTHCTQACSDAKVGPLPAELALTTLEYRDAQMFARILGR